MRAILYTLALANLLFFAWAYWIDVAPAATAASTVPRLQLATLNGAPQSPGAAAAAATPGGAATPAPRCAALGPLADAATVTALTTALRARNLAPRERQTHSDVVEGYWVYIDRLDDPAARSRALRRLARNGVRDAAALAESGQVSVGLFSEQTGAEKRAAAVRAAGFEPVIEARSHAVVEHWLDVDLVADVPPPAVPALIAGLNLESAPAWGECPAPVATPPAAN